MIKMYHTLLTLPLCTKFAGKKFRFSFDLTFHIETTATPLSYRGFEISDTTESSPFTIKQHILKET